MDLKLNLAEHRIHFLIFTTTLFYLGAMGTIAEIGEYTLKGTLMQI